MPWESQHDARGIGFVAEGYLDAIGKIHDMLASPAEAGSPDWKGSGLVLAQCLHECGYFRVRGAKSITDEKWHDATNCPKHMIP